MDHLDSLYQKVAEVETLRMKVSYFPAGPDKSNLEGQALDLSRGLNAELLGLRGVFAPYLKFRVWKRWWWPG